jgi:hypothetical protein
MPSSLRERAEQRREQLSGVMRDRLDRLRERGLEGRQRRERAAELRKSIDEQIKSGNPHPDELKKQLEELKSLRDDRRYEQRAFIRRHWGRAMHKPDVREELERHARRLARLQRLEVVAATERTGDQRKKLIERIEKLRTQENERHEEVMKKLVPEGPTPEPSASAAPAAAPTPSSSGGAL